LRVNDLALTNPLPADQNPALVYVAGLPSKSGQRTQAQALRLVAEMLGGDVRHVRWSALRYQHTAAIRSQLIGRYPPATVNRILAALRGCLRACWRLGQMPAEDFQRAIDLHPLSGETLPAGRELSSGEILALMQACQRDKTTAGTRDAAMIALLYAVGLRRAEIVALNLADADTGTGRLVVHGKRSKERTAYLNNGALDALGDWLAIRGRSDAPLFVPINRGGHVASSRLSTQAVYNMLLKRGSEAAVDNFSPHDLRRTFISDLLDKGADLATVSKMAGHANVQTTVRYDRRPEEAKQKAAGLLHVPYKRKRA
jgi:site-specific recombinase XerD